MRTLNRVARMEDSFERQWKAREREEQERERRIRKYRDRCRWADDGQFNTLAIKFEEAREESK